MATWNCSNEICGIGARGETDTREIVGPTTVCSYGD